MSDSNQSHQHSPNRASIRGKGREILLGSGLADARQSDSNAASDAWVGEESARDYSPEELIEILELPKRRAGESSREEAPHFVPNPAVDSTETNLTDRAKSTKHQPMPGDSWIDDTAMKQLWSDIETLRAKLLETLKEDRDAVELYWQDLADAGSLVLDSRANYGRARDMVYRVQTDLARRTQLRRLVRRYRPWLLGYLALWAVVWVALVALESTVKGWGTEQGATLLVAAYLPILYGLLGGVADGFMRLTRSMGPQQNFDTLDVPSYLLAPIGGAVMGLFLVLLASLANEALLDGLGTTLEKAAVWTLAFVAGLNYDAITKRLAGLIRPAALK